MVFASETSTNIYPDSDGQSTETQLIEERQRYQDLLKKLQEKGIDPGQL